MDIKNKLQSLQQTLNVAYTKPDVHKFEQMVENLRGSPAWGYLTKERGFTEETIEHFKLGYDTKKNAVAIPHFKNGELINIKFRFIAPKETRYTSEPNAEPWVFHEEGFIVGKDKGAVAIAEGEFDCMALWQMGFKNAVSPGSGANSYGPWIEIVDTIKSAWIAYDNDEPGQSAAKQLAERIGVEKCRNVRYPEGTKDANEFMLKHNSSDLRELFSKSMPFYKYEFSGLGDVLHKMMDDPMDYLEIALLPNVKLERDNLIVVSGETNAGKSTYSLNVIKELAHRGIPSLFLPIERGVYSLGRRYIQIEMGKTQEDMQFTPRDEWEKAIRSLAPLPVYMAKPSINELERTIARAKRLFGVRLVIIDHMDYLIRGSMNKESLISEKMHALKHCAEENGVIIVVISHINRGATQGGVKPTLKNLKGSSSLEQDAEIVVMLYPTEDLAGIEIDVQKNKGSMTKKTFGINVATGVISGTYDPNNF